MKKATLWMMVTMMCLSVLTGCGGKTAEQQAVEEIRQQMQKEAADYQDRTRSKAQEREEKQKVREELNAYYNPLLQAEYDAMIAADTPEDTMAHGDRYNELIEERDALGKEAGIVWSGRSSYNPIDRSYVSKAMFLSAKEYSDYDEYTVYHRGASLTQGGRPDTLLLMYAKKDTNDNWTELMFIREDFSSCRLAFGDYIDSYGPCEITNISDSYLELCAINLDWTYFLFDISGSKAVLVDKSSDHSDDDGYRVKVEAAFPYEERMGESYDYKPAEDDTLEGLNKMIIKNSEFGAASQSYQ